MRELVFDNAVKIELVGREIPNVNCILRTILLTSGWIVLGGLLKFV